MQHHSLPQPCLHLVVSSECQLPACQACSNLSWLLDRRWWWARRTGHVARVCLVVNVCSCTCHLCVQALVAELQSQIRLLGDEDSLRSGEQRAQLASLISSFNDLRASCEQQVRIMDFVWSANTTFVGGGGGMCHGFDAMYCSRAQRLVACRGLQTGWHGLCASHHSSCQAPKAAELDQPLPRLPCASRNPAPRLPSNCPRTVCALPPAGT